jgi:hypothetical protein
LRRVKLTGQEKFLFILGMIMIISGIIMMVTGRIYGFLLIFGGYPIVGLNWPVKVNLPPSQEE